MLSLSRASGRNPVCSGRSRVTSVCLEIVAGVDLTLILMWHQLPARLEPVYRPGHHLEPKRYSPGLYLLGSRYPLNDCTMLGISDN